MQQYFIEQPASVGDVIEMNREQAHHIGHVMRMRALDVIRIADVNAHLFYAQVEFTGPQVFARIMEPIEDHTRTKVSISLAQCLIKGEKWDYLLQKSAELGVESIYPFTSSRCVVKTKNEKLDKKMQRWNKILQEACEQCKRSTLVGLHVPMRLQELGTIQADLKLIAYEDADTNSQRLCDILQEHKDVSSVAVAVGCEGGFSKEEVKELEEQGYHCVSLGSRILRAETAAISLINSISFYYELVGEGK